MRSNSVLDEIAPLRDAVAPQLTVKTFRGVDEIEEIRRAWTAWNDHPNSDIDLYLDLLRSRPEILRAHVIVLYRDGEPEAMLVGRILRDRLQFRLGYRTVLKQKVRLLSIVWGGALGNLSSGNCDLLVSQVVQCLRNREADVAVFNNMKAESPICSSVLAVRGLFSRDYFPSRQVHRSLVVPKSVEDFHRGLSAKERWNQKSKAKKLFTAYGGNVRVSSYPGTIELDQAIREAETVARKTYQRGLGVGFGEIGPSRQRFELDARNERLRIYILYVAGKPSAFWIGSIYQRTFHGAYTGYDPDLAHYSPGMFLMMRIIEEFCKRENTDEVDEIDFGLGDAQYKEALCNQQWEDVTIYVFGCTYCGLRVNMLRIPIAGFDRIARRMLKSVGLFGKVKRLWRDSVRRE